METIVICTGGWDPVHSGHIAYFEAAKALGDKLIVGVNSDAWLVRKKGQPFMPLNERMAIVGAMDVVDGVMTFDDADNSACAIITQVLSAYPEDNIIFANGGDRTADNIPEMSNADPRLTFEFGVGGEDKKNSSSWILEQHAHPRTSRPWGDFIVLHNDPDYKVKELILNPGESISKQYHYHRREIWLVIEGTGRVTVNDKDRLITPGDIAIIEIGDTHKLTNPGKLPLRITEIQQGKYLEEDDIIRLDLNTLSTNDKYKGTQGTK